MLRHSFIYFAALRILGKKGNSNNDQKNRKEGEALTNDNFVTKTFRYRFEYDFGVSVRL